MAARLSIMRLLVEMAETEPPSNPGVRFNPFTKQAEPRPFEPFEALVKATQATQDVLKAHQPRIRALCKHSNADMRTVAKELNAYL